MNKEKVKLIIKNMELLVQSLKLELEEPVKENVVKLEDIIKSVPYDEYEPDYYEEEE